MIQVQFHIIWVNTMERHERWRLVYCSVSGTKKWQCHQFIPIIRGIVFKNSPLISKPPQNRGEILNNCQTPPKNPSRNKGGFLKTIPDVLPVRRHPNLALCRTSTDILWTPPYKTPPCFRTFWNKGGFSQNSVRRAGKFWWIMLLKHRFS